MIFNREYVRTRRIRALNCEKFESVNYIFSYGEQIIQDLIEDLNKEGIKEILIHGNRGAYPLNIIKNYFPSISIEEEFYSNQVSFEKKYDLIISFFDISSIDNLLLFFSSIFNSLSEEGVFIGTLIGENSLMNTRQKLWSLESEATGKYSARIWPMIKLTDLTHLIQRAGFLNLISFVEKYEHRYSNLYEFLSDIRYMGESGGLKMPEYFPRFLYNKLKEEKDGSYKENFEFINFCASKTSKIFASNVNI